MRESNISIHGSKIVHRILVNYTEFVCPFCCTTLSPFSNLYICILKGLIDRVKLLGCSFFYVFGQGFMLAPRAFFKLQIKLCHWVFNLQEMISWGAIRVFEFVSIW